MAANITPDPLQRIIEREEFADIPALLSPRDLIVAVLRLEDLTDSQIAALMGLKRTAISTRMRRACQRISTLRPDLAPLLEGRSLGRGPQERQSRRPLERGWLCVWDEEEQDE